MYYRLNEASDAAEYYAIQKIIYINYKKYLDKCSIWLYNVTVLFLKSYLKTPDFYRIRRIGNMESEPREPLKAVKRRLTFSSYLADGYWSVFGHEWPPWLGGILLGFLNFALFAYAAPWFIYGGFVNWGSWIIKLVGIKPASDPVAPWLNTGSVQDFAIFVGAFIAIMAANNFRPRMPQRKIRLLEGFAGGLLMGTGAMLAPG